MWRWLFALFVLCLHANNVVTAVYTYKYNIKLLNETCTVSMIENRDVTFDKKYNSLKSSVGKSIMNIYAKAGKSVFSIAVGRTSCLSSNEVLLNVEVQLNSKNNNSDTKRILSSSVNDIQGANVSSVVADGDSTPYVPSIRNRVKTTLPKSVACELNVHADFRTKLAAKLIVIDDAKGVVYPSNERFVFSDKCAAISESSSQHAMFDFYVSKENDAFTPDTGLTVLAYKVVDQMIYDGSTWKLGFPYHQHIDDITLVGADDGHEGLSDVEIIFLGFGIICAILLLILIIILVAKYHCNCCLDEVVDEEKRVRIQPIQNVDEMDHGKSWKGSIKVRHDNTTVFINPTPEEKALSVELEDAVLPYREVSVDVVPSSTKPLPPMPSRAQEMPQPLQPEVVPEVIPTSNTDVDDTYVTMSGSDDDSDSDDDDVSGKDKELSLDELLVRVEDDKALNSEFRGLLSRTPTLKAYSQVQNEKNREKNVFPWTHKRVLLAVSDGDDQDTDYINASFVKNSRRQVAFISTQAPLDTTIGDFWQMIWEQSVSVVVIGTPLNHRGDKKCVQYWPTNQAEERIFGIYTVSLESNDLVPDYVITRVVVTDGATKRQVTIYRFMSWPILGLPNSSELVKSLLKLLSDVRHQLKTNPSISLFHGSSSRGFGAVLLAILIAIEEYDTSKTVCVKRVVRCLRKDQAGAIENLAQYKYIYQAICAYAEQQ